ncbi:MAG TPA: hypothetical protein VGD17_09895 [Chitinophagaceae bacterium]
MNLMTNCIELFKTDVLYEYRANEILQMLTDKYPAYKMNFDLHDRDNMLRVESTIEGIDIDGIIMLLKGSGHYAEVLED